MEALNKVTCMFFLQNKNGVIYINIFYTLPNQIISNYFLIHIIHMIIYEFKLQKKKGK